MAQFLYRLGRWCADRAGRVLALWLALLIAVGGAAASFGTPMTSKFSLPGSDFQRVLKLTNQRDYTDPALEYLKLYSPLFEVPNPGTLPASIAGEAPSDETPPEVLNWVI